MGMLKSCYMYQDVASVPFATAHLACVPFLSMTVAHETHEICHADVVGVEFGLAGHHVQYGVENGP